MTKPDFESAPLTHDLLVKSAGYHEATTAILNVALDRATTGFVRIDHDELETNVEDAPRCRETWRDVQNSFSWMDARPGAWYRGNLPDTAEEFRRLWTLTDGMCGIHFVREIALYDGDEWLFFAVPHHTYCWLRDAEETFVGDVDDVLSDQRACVFRDGTHVEWERDGREYSISSTSLCVGGGSFRTSGCYGLSNLDSVRAGEELTLWLDWQVDPMPGIVGRLLAGAMSLVYNPPERLQFDDETTFREAESVLTTILEKRDTPV